MARGGAANLTITVGPILFYWASGVGRLGGFAEEMGMGMEWVGGKTVRLLMKVYIFGERKKKRV